jgi:alpha-L-rhamnosidase
MNSQLPQLIVHSLRCEYAVNPLGIDVRAPRFSWALTDERRGQMQTAYQVQVASSHDALLSKAADLWDSGKVLSAEQVAIAYMGAALHSGQRACWRVRAWDCDGQPSAWSEAAWFEMALLDEADWVSLWYGYPAGDNGKALYFRSALQIDKPLVAARAYVAGLGLYEFYVNGVKADDRVLDPAQTDYAQRVLYSTYDITDLLQPGANVVGAIVGHGWHGAPKLRAQLHLRFADGTTRICAMTRTGMSEADWQVSTGPILANSIYDGETYDARRERPHWCEVRIGNDDVIQEPNLWHVGVPVDAPRGRMQTQPLEPMRVIESLTPVSVTEPLPGQFVFDMGQNMVGWVRLRVQGERGQAVTLRFAENLADDGPIDQGNLRSAVCTDTYILKGAGIEEWEPRFTYHGFRYVQVAGYPGRPTLDAIVGRVVHSDAAPHGHFACSNDLLNRLQRAVLWTESGNLHGLPTDCPQRDERMGWLNDMTVRAEEANYNFDLNRLHTKWIADIHDGQDTLNGAIPDTAPYRMGARPADPVTMCYLLVPWLLYQYYGNTQAMSEHYDGLKAWIDYLTSRSREGLVEYSYYGDWSPPVAEAVPTSLGAGAVSKGTPGALISTGYYYYGSKLLSQIAAVLGRREDAYAYGAQADRIRRAYNVAFWDESRGVYGSGNQACCAFTLYMGLAPEERHAQVLATLVADVEAHEYHLTTGNLCSKYLLEVLSACGRHDVAYRLITQTTYPSWGYMLACGATTIWERWEHTKETGMHSKNHPMMATFSAWFYRYLAGIQLLPGSVAFAPFVIRPYLVNGLDFVEAHVDTLRGRVASSWRRTSTGLTLQVSVPVNTQARVSIPVRGHAAEVVIRESGRVLWQQGGVAELAAGISAATDDGEWVTFDVGSGEYQFEVTQG